MSGAVWEGTGQGVNQGGMSKIRLSGPSSEHRLIGRRPSRAPNAPDSPLQAYRPDRPISSPDPCTPHRPVSMQRAAAVPALLPLLLVECHPEAASDSRRSCLGETVPGTSLRTKVFVATGALYQMSLTSAENEHHKRTGKRVTLHALEKHMSTSLVRFVRFMAGRQPFCLAPNILCGCISHLASCVHDHLSTPDANLFYKVFPVSSVQ